LSPAPAGEAAGAVGAWSGEVERVKGIEPSYEVG
jgi:hypothetical protein